MRLVALACSIMVMALAITAAPGQAARNFRFTPDGPWNMDYGNERCTLTRMLRGDEGPVYVQFIRTAPTDEFSLNLIGKPFVFNAGQASVRLRFGDGQRSYKSDGLSGSIGGLPALFLEGRLDNLTELGPFTKARPEKLPAITAAQESAVSSLAVSVAGKGVRLELGSLGPPMAALRRCTADLVKTWRLDPEEQAALAHGPLPLINPNRWLSPDDYPNKPLYQGQQAIIGFRLMIDASGMPTSCVVQTDVARSPSFAERSCLLLQRRARFEPARKADGTPVASFYTSRVIWILP